MNDASQSHVTHLLIDLIADHEVDRRLATECSTIFAILSNRGDSPRHIVASSSKSLKRQRPGTPHGSVAFVHLAAHTDEGTGNPVFINNDELSWSALAKVLKRYVPPLRRGQQRTLSLSCCSSTEGQRDLARHLDEWFTGCYYFGEDELLFAKTAVAWGIFYLRKDVSAPIRKLLVKRGGKTAFASAAQVINAAVPGVSFKFARWS